MAFFKNFQFHLVVSWHLLVFKVYFYVMCADGLLQISVAVTSSSLCTDSDKFTPSPKILSELSEPCSASVDTVCPVTSAVDNGTVGTVKVSDVSVLSSVSVVSNGFLAVRSSGGGGKVRRCRSAECQVSHTGSYYSTSSSPGLSSLQITCSGTGVISSPSLALNPQTKSPSASTQPVYWDVRMSPGSALRTPQHTVVPSLSTSVLTSPPENNRHRSVKAGSTWFPTELQTSLDCGSAKKRNVERSSSAHASIVSNSGSTLNSPLKKFVDRHSTRNIAAGTNISHSSSLEVAGFSRSGIAVTPELTSDQPMDLSTSRRRSAHNFEQSNGTHFDSAATTCDEPLDLSRSSHPVRPDSRTTRHHQPVVCQSNRSESVRKLALPQSQSSRTPSENKRALSSGMIDLQNYCSRLLSGGYSLDSPLLSTITSSAAASFSSLVSINVHFYATREYIIICPIAIA